MHISSLIKKTFLTLALLGHLSVVLLGVFHIAHMAKIDMPMEHCPFALGNHSLCQMNVADHIKAWRELSTTLLPTIKILFLVSVIFILFSFAYHIPPITHLLLYQKRERIEIIPLYQLLFSKGILNPKIP